MNVANIYRKLKQILDDSNVALVNKGLCKVDKFNKIIEEIEKLGEINRLPYFVSGDFMSLTESDLENVTSIYYDERLNKGNLIKVTIPNSVITIGKSAFKYCSSLKDIYMRPTTPPALDNIDAIPSITTIHVPMGSGDDYKNATNWSSFANKIVEDIILD